MNTNVIIKNIINLSDLNRKIDKKKQKTPKPNLKNAIKTIYSMPSLTLILTL